MLVDQQKDMFCGFAITRKRKIDGMTDTEVPYGVTTPPPDEVTTPPPPTGLEDLPWWADVVDSHELADLIRNHCAEKVLLIDCRSFIEFNQSNIVNSINVCCNKIVKRRLQTNKLKIQDYLSSTCHVEVDKTYTIIVYDSSTTDASALPDDNIVSILGNKCSQTFQRVRVLYGGFLEFQQNHPSLLETKTKTPNQQAAASLSQPCMPVTNIGPTKILPYLFLGSMKDALNADLAKSMGVTYVLNVSNTCPKPAHIQDSNFLRIPVNDNYSEKLLPHFHEAFQFIDKVRESGGCVLVHCLAGVSRSPTLAIAYIMRTYHMVSEEAYRYVKEKRITISPNFNFLGQLLEYEQQMEREGSSHLSGSKRRCIEDLRAELATPSSPSSTPRMPKSISLDPAMFASGARTAGVVGSRTASSPTAALAKLRFEHCLTAGVTQGSHSPTAAFAKLRFGALTASEGLPLTPKPSAQPINEEPEFMHCYSSETKHRNASTGSTPTAAPRSLSLHILNCNNSNNSSMDRSEGSPSPNSKASRPMSLSLTRLDEATPTTPKRPVSLAGAKSTPLQDASVSQLKECRTDQISTTVAEATPPSETDRVPVSQATSNSLTTPVDFKQPESTVQLREQTSPRSLKIRPKSVALAQNSPKERVATPMTPTKDYLASPQLIPSNLDMILKYSQETFKSRSLEDSLNKADRVCLTCSSIDKCLCHEVIPKLSVAQSTGSISSTGSHNSLHGSLEVIKVL